MSIKTETSYGNISWKGSIGCSLIGITGKEKNGPIDGGLVWVLFFFCLNRFFLHTFKKMIAFDMLFIFHGESAGRIASWLMRWDWAKLFSPLPSCRRYIM